MKIYDERVARIIKASMKFVEQEPPDCTDHASLRRFSKRCPNPLETAFECDSLVPLWTPKSSGPEFSFAFMSAAQMWNRISPAADLDVPEPPPEPEFEVNMMEALIGWRGWIMGSDGLLRAINTPTVWEPDMALEAECHNSVDHRRGWKVVNEECTCGIYAASELAHVPGVLGKHPHIVIGTVYGWGRYIRGETGWRAQYAYPKEFFLHDGQSMNLAVALKKYHVPVHMDIPTQLYNPEEDGYGYRNDKANRDSGAVDNSSSEEARGPSFDADPDYDD